VFQRLLASEWDQQVCTVFAEGSPAMEYALYVTTLQSESFKIDRLPDQFMGFQVRRINWGDWPDAYMRVWKRLFKEIRGWSEEQTLEWAKKWGDGIKSYNSVFFSSGPDKLAAPNLIDDQTKTLLGSHDYNDLIHDIRALITEKEIYGPSGSGTGFPPLVRPGALDEYDWDYVRRRIRELVEKYGQKHRGD
jgi:hypothetical protein